MHIEPYTDKYYIDVVEIVKSFHAEAIAEYDAAFDPDQVINTITSLKDTQSQNAFLLIIEDRCVGMLAGIEIESFYNKNRIFQELIWYVDQKFRSRGVYLLKKVMEELKGRGFTKMVMAVLENSKTEKLKELYIKMGFKPMETHFIKGL